MGPALLGSSDLYVICKADLTCQVYVPYEMPRAKAYSGASQHNSTVYRPT